MENKSIIIEAGKTEKDYYKDLLEFHELLLFLGWRDILSKYKQTIFGFLWAIIRPISSVIVFSVIFGDLAKLPSEGVPYPIMVFSAMLPWQFFSSYLNKCTGSIVGNSGLVSKIYFPRLIIPLSSVFDCLVEFIFSFICLIFLMIWYKFIPNWAILGILAFLLLAFIISLGMGLWFAALNTKYRDFGYLVPFLLQLGQYLTPVAYSSSVIPLKWRLLYSLNPLVGVVDGFRWSILGGKTSIYLSSIISSITLAVVILLSGIWYFRKVEKTFADII